MRKTAYIVWTCVGIGITISLLVASVLMGYRMTPTSTPCTSLVYVIEDRDERMYLTERELTQMLETADLYPVGRAQNAVSLNRIEQAVRCHPMVRTAECYITPRNEVRICITQRQPLLRVQTPAEMYFIDTDRRVMPVRASIKDRVMLANGTIGVQMASKTLADFAEWLENNDYWCSRVHHVHVASPQMVYLYLRNSSARVVMGNMRGYERKLNKLQTFLTESSEIIKDKNYTELDVRYRGQVIGRY